MQQTSKYKLNKPEVDDTIAIAPLNENMDKIEAALTAEAAGLRAECAAGDTALSQKVTALSQRVTALEGKHTVLVTYTGDGTQGRVIKLGFTPTGGLYINAFTNMVALLAPGDAPGITPAIVEGGVLVPNSQPNYQYNVSGAKYRIILFN